MKKSPNRRVIAGAAINLANRNKAGKKAKADSKLEKKADKKD